MDKLFDLIVPQLPGWSIIPAAAILLFFIAWPTLQAIWKETVPSYRLYTREKMRLELLKLLYEVEALKKDHQLGDMESLLPQRFQERGTKDALTEAQHKKYLSWSKAMLFGAIGGSGANIAIVLMRDYTFFSYMVPLELLGLLIAVIFYGLIGGVIAVFSKPLTPTDAVIRGGAGTLAILLFVTFMSGGFSRQQFVVPSPAQHGMADPGTTFVVAIEKTRFIASWPVPFHRET